MDDAPTVYIDGNPGQAGAVTRQLEQDVAKVQAFDPVVNADVPITARLAGGAEMSFLHMITADPARTPTFTLFVTAQIESITARRNAIASQMIAILEGAAFANQHVNERQAADLIVPADELLNSTK
jgi:hypothetical protein